MHAFLDIGIRALHRGPYPQISSHRHPLLYNDTKHPYPPSGITQDHLLSTPLMRRLLFSLALVLGLVGCDSVIDSPGLSSTSDAPVTANAEDCGPFGCEEPPASCPAPPRPYHDWSYVGSNKALNAYLDNRTLDKSAGNSYRLQHDAYGSGSYTTLWGEFNTLHPTNPIYYVKTVTQYGSPYPSNGGYLRVKRTCPNGAVSYSPARYASSSASFQQSWHHP